MTLALPQGQALWVNQALPQGQALLLASAADPLAAAPAPDPASAAAAWSAAAEGLVHCEKLPLDAPFCRCSEGCS